MNVSSPEQTEGPSFPNVSGDVMDRMEGSMPNRSLEDLKKVSGDLSKATPGGSKDGGLSKLSLDLGRDGVALKNSDPKGEEKPDLKKKRARKKWKKPKDKPNRPLSAYNLFFQAERANMLGDVAHLHEPDKSKKRVHRKTHGKVGFAEMARLIGQKWKDLPADERKPFEDKAATEKKRYATELAAWKEEQKQKAKSKQRELALAKSLQDEQKFGNQHSSGMDGSSADSLRMQMMAEGVNMRNLGLLNNMDYLRLMKERQAAMAAMYPNASEASANAILQQFQANMGGMPMGGMPGMMSDMMMSEMMMSNGNPGSGNNDGISNMNMNMNERLQQLRGMGGSNDMTAGQMNMGNGGGMSGNMGMMQGMGNQMGMGGGMQGNMMGNMNMNGMNMGGMNMNPDMAAAMRRFQQANRFNM